MATAWLGERLPAIDVPATRIRPGQGGSLNEALAQVGECFLLPLGPAETLPELLRGEQDVRWIYGAGCRTRITAQADAVFFVRESTPLPEGYRDLVIPGA